MHLQNGESSAGIFDFVNNDEGSYFEGYQHNLFYSKSHYPIFILQPNTNLKKQNGIWSGKFLLLTLEFRIPISDLHVMR